MKKFLLLISSTLLTLTCLSQSGTDTSKKTVTVTVATMRSMIKDIVKGDQCDEERKVLNQNIGVLNQRIVEKDKTIAKVEQLNANTETELKNERMIAKLNNIKTIADSVTIIDKNKEIKKLNRQLKGGNIVKWGLGIGLAAALVKIFFFK